MEIDFLGLNFNSHKFCVEQEDSKNNVFADSGGVEISLSLSTSSHKEILNFSEKKKTWEFLACDKMIPSCSGSKLAPYSPEISAKNEQLLLVATPVFHRPSAAGFLYDLNDAASSNSRSNSELPTQSPTSTMLYPRCPTVFNQPEKADKTMYIAGNASTRLPRTGYTPTVAMARKATLARFLEKRSHSRMNQRRTSPLMGKPPSVPISEAWETSITTSNKKRNNNLKR
ncbi:hypothetical protein ACS0TY_008842 [Phlomoides rotata]